MLHDGIHLTVPIHGNPNATRWVEVEDGAIKINGWTFTQEDFFKVNRLVANSHTQGSCQEIKLAAELGG